MPGVLIGLNVGLAAGLMGAYLPDQSHYGPTWKRVVLVDLAMGAGAIAGATFGCVFNPDCLSNSLSDPNNPAANRARSIAAFAALGGAAVGLAGGILLTRHFDDDRPDTPAAASTPPPIAMFAPMRDAAGNMAPAFAAMGFF
jgi:membrane associated rhomboid family serine protease